MRCLLMLTEQRMEFVACVIQIAWLCSRSARHLDEGRDRSASEERRRIERQYQLSVGTKGVDAWALAPHGRSSDDA